MQRFSVAQGISFLLKFKNELLVSVIFTFVLKIPINVLLLTQTTIITSLICFTTHHFVKFYHFDLDRVSFAPKVTQKFSFLIPLPPSLTPVRNEFHILNPAAQLEGGGNVQFHQMANFIQIGGSEID